MENHVLPFADCDLHTFVARFAGTNGSDVLPLASFLQVDLQLAHRLAQTCVHMRLGSLGRLGFHGGTPTNGWFMSWKIPI